jgi:hypothetical protein
MKNIKKPPTDSQNLFVLGFFFIAFFLLIAFFYYNATKDYTTLVDEIQGIFNNYEREIPSDMIPIPQNLKVSYIMWLYFENNSENSNWFSNFTADKYILRKGYGPDIMYNPYSNTLKVGVKVKDVREPINTNTEENVNQELNNSKIDFKEKVQEIEVTNIPIQKWTQIVVTIDNRFVDIYVDAVLVKSAKLDNVPILNHTDIKLGKPKHNPNMYMGKLQYKPDVISLSEINGLYFRDNGSFTIDDKVKNKVIFDAKKIKEDSYKVEKLQDMIDTMNREDPI